MSNLQNVRENALVKGAAKLYPRLELECEGKRAVLLGGHQDHIDSVNVQVDGGDVILLSEWVLERCLHLTPNTMSPEKERRVTLTSAHIVSYGNQHVQRTPLLQWCQSMCTNNGVSSLPRGTRLMVFWWDMRHDAQAKGHMEGSTWWPSIYVPEHSVYGTWFSAEVVRYDAKKATLHIVYDYNAPEEPKEEGSVILPLNYVHFGDSPPLPGEMAQVLPMPWKPPSPTPKLRAETTVPQRKAKTPAAASTVDVVVVDDDELEDAEPAARVLVSMAKQPGKKGKEAATAQEPTKTAPRPLLPQGERGQRQQLEEQQALPRQQAQQPAPASQKLQQQQQQQPKPHVSHQQEVKKQKAERDRPGSQVQSTQQPPKGKQPKTKEQLEQPEAARKPQQLETQKGGFASDFSKTAAAAADAAVADRSTRDRADAKGGSEANKADGGTMKGAAAKDAARSRSDAVASAAAKKRKAEGADKLTAGARPMAGDPPDKRFPTLKEAAQREPKRPRPSSDESKAAELRQPLPAEPSHVRPTSSDRAAAGPHHKSSPAAVAPVPPTSKERLPDPPPVKGPAATKPPAATAAGALADSKEQNRRQPSDQKQPDQGGSRKRARREEAPATTSSPAQAELLPSSASAQTRQRKPPPPPIVSGDKDRRSEPRSSSQPPAVEGSKQQCDGTKAPAAAVEVKGGNARPPKPPKPAAAPSTDPQPPLGSCAAAAGTGGHQSANPSAFKPVGAAQPSAKRKSPPQSPLPILVVGTKKPEAISGRTAETGPDGGKRARKPFPSPADGSAAGSVDGTTGASRKGAGFDGRGKGVKAAFRESSEGGAVDVSEEGDTVGQQQPAAGAAAVASAAATVASPAGPNLLGRPAEELALGPTSRLRWPGLGLMEPSKLRELARIPAVQPRAVPRCDAHVQLLKAQAEVEEKKRLAASKQDCPSAPDGAAVATEAPAGLVAPPGVAPPGADAATDTGPQIANKADNGDALDVAALHPSPVEPQEEAPEGISVAAVEAAAAVAGPSGASVVPVAAAVAAIGPPDAMDVDQDPALERAGSSPGFWSDDLDAFPFATLEEAGFKMVTPDPARLAAYEALGRDPASALAGLGLAGVTADGGS